LNAVTVTLVAKTGLRANAAVQVDRDPRRRQREVIYVDLSKATPRDLAMSLQALRIDRLRRGDSLTVGIVGIPTSASFANGWDRTEYARWLDQQLERLRGTRERAVHRLGSVKAVQIRIPASDPVAGR
jgi:hypothetical protein